MVLPLSGILGGLLSSKGVFPLIVTGAMMIEPTETASKAELDAFIEAMLAIAEEAEQNPELVRTAPHTARLTRLDEATAAREPVLRWKPPSSS
jgi:glycine dehydrogenase subunit 2